MTDKIIRYEKYGRCLAGAGSLTKALYMTFTPFGFGGNPEALEDALKSVVEKAVADALAKAGMKALAPEATPTPAAASVQAPVSEAWVLCPVLPGANESEVNGEIVTNRPIEGYLEGRAQRDQGYVLESKVWRIVVPIESLEPGSLFRKGDWGVLFAKGRIIAEGTLDEMHKRFVDERGGDFVGLADLKDVSILKQSLRSTAKTILGLTSAAIDGAVAAVVRDKCTFDWHADGAVAIAGSDVTGGNAITVVQHPAINGATAKTHVGQRCVVANRTNVEAGANSVVVLRDKGTVTATGNDVFVVAYIGYARATPVTLNKDDRAEIVDGALKVTPATKHEKTKKDKR